MIEFTYIMKFITYCNLNCAMLYSLVKRNEMHIMERNNISLLIADDEREIRSGLSRAIDWAKYKHFSGRYRKGRNRSLRGNSTAETGYCDNRHKNARHRRTDSCKKNYGRKTDLQIYHSEWLRGFWICTKGHSVSRARISSQTHCAGRTGIHREPRFGRSSSGACQQPGK